MKDGRTTSKAEKESLLEEMNDYELIQAYLNGSSSAFDLLYSRYRRPLYAYLNKLFQGQECNADDIFQQTWLKAIDNLEKYQNRERFLAWLMRIAHNLSIDSFRRNARNAEDSLDDLQLDAQLIAHDPSSSPSGALEGAELADAIRTAVNDLSPDLREVFLLRQEDLSFKEIAEIQKCSLNTCLARMQYALKNLRRGLQSWTERKAGGK